MEPLSRLSAKARPVGYTVTQYWCRKCAPDGLRDGYEPMREGEDYGVPYHCDTCGADLLPCDHQWENEWHAAFGGGEIRFCKAPDCGEAEYR